MLMNEIINLFCEMDSIVEFEIYFYHLIEFET